MVVAAVESFVERVVVVVPAVDSSGERLKVPLDC
jgi:hypothetical protein